MVDTGSSNKGAGTRGMDRRIMGYDTRRDEEEIMNVDKDECGFAWRGNALSFGHSAGRSQWTWTVHGIGT